MLHINRTTNGAHCIEASRRGCRAIYCPATALTGSSRLQCWRQGLCASRCCPYLLGTSGRGGKASWSDGSAMPAARQHAPQRRHKYQLQRQRVQFHFHHPKGVHWAARMHPICRVRTYNAHAYLPATEKKKKMAECEVTGLLRGAARCRAHPASAFARAQLRRTMQSLLPTS